MERLKVQAQHLQKGDVVGSGETVLNVSAGLRTPSGKIEVTLSGEKRGTRYIRTSVWGKQTVINICRGDLDGREA